MQISFISFDLKYISNIENTLKKKKKCYRVKYPEII